MKKEKRIKNPIIWLRKELDINPTQMAAELGVTAQTVSHYEHFARYPKIEIAYRLIDFAERSNKALSLEDIYPRERFL